MRHRTRRAPLLLLPLLAAACTPAAPRDTAAPAPAEAFVQVERVDPRTLVVDAERPGYAYLVEVTPSRERPARLVNGGEPVPLDVGRQRLSTQDNGRGDTPTANARVSEADRRYCAPGSRQVGSRGPGARAQSLMRPVPRSATCVRQDPSVGYLTGTEETGLLLIATVAPLEPAALRDAVSAANARRASSSASSQGVSARVVDALRDAGIAAHAVRVP